MAYFLQPHISMDFNESRYESDLCHQHIASQTAVSDVSTDDKRRSLGDLRDSSYVQTKETLCISVKAISALYLSKVAPKQVNICLTLYFTLCVRFSAKYVRNWAGTVQGGSGQNQSSSVEGCETLGNTKFISVHVTGSRLAIFSFMQDYQANYLPG